MGETLWDVLQLPVATPLWQLVLLVGVSVSTLTVVLVRMVAGMRNKQHPYRRDLFFGMNWRWGYEGKQLVHLQSYCPDDDCELVYSQDKDQGIAFRCETCDRQYSQYSMDINYLRGMVRRQIERKLRTGEWRQGAAASTAPVTENNLADSATSGAPESKSAVS